MNNIIGKEWNIQKKCYFINSSLWKKLSISKQGFSVLKLTNTLSVFDSHLQCNVRFFRSLSERNDLEEKEQQEEIEFLNSTSSEGEHSSNLLAAFQEIEENVDVYKSLESILADETLTLKERQKQIEERWAFNIYDAMHAKPSLYHVRYFKRFIGPRKLNAFKTHINDYMQDKKTGFANQMHNWIAAMLKLIIERDPSLSKRYSIIEAESNDKMISYLKDEMIKTLSSYSMLDDLVARILIHILSLSTYGRVDKSILINKEDDLNSDLFINGMDKNLLSNNDIDEDDISYGYVTTRSEVADTLQQMSLGLFYSMFKVAFEKMLENNLPSFQDITWGGLPWTLQSYLSLKSKVASDCIEILQTNSQVIMFSILTLMSGENIIKMSNAVTHRRRSQSVKKQIMIFCPLIYGDLIGVTQHLPMISKPLNWKKGGVNGGILSNSVKSTKNTRLSLNVVKNLVTGSSSSKLSEECLKAINLTQAKSYRICPEALKILEDIFEKKEYSSIRRELGLLTEDEMASLKDRKYKLENAGKDSQSKLKTIYEEWENLKSRQLLLIEKNNPDVTSMVIETIEKYCGTSPTRNRNGILSSKDKKIYFKLLYDFNYSYKIKQLQKEVSSWKQLRSEIESADSSKLLWKRNIRIARMYSPFKFYFPNFADFRLRFYPMTYLFTRTSGMYKYLLKSADVSSYTAEGKATLYYSLFSSVSEEKAKILLNWDFSAWYKSIEGEMFSKELSELTTDEQFLTKYKDTIKSGDEFRCLLMFREIKKVSSRPRYKSGFMIEFDQRSSGPQIAGLLYGDNMLCDAAFKSSYQDIYGYIQEKFLIKLKELNLDNHRLKKEGIPLLERLQTIYGVKPQYHNVDLLSLNKNVNFMNSEHNPLIWTLEESDISWFFEKLELIFRKRKTWKYIIMCGMYKQGNLARTKEHVWATLLHDYGSVCYEWLPVQENFYFNLCLKITQMYETLLTECFPIFTANLENICKWSNFVTKLQWEEALSNRSASTVGINWLTLDGCSITYLYYDRPNIKARYYDTVRKRMVQTRINVTSSKTSPQSSLQKQNIAFPANLIHSYDSTFMRQMVLSYHEKTSGRILEPLHDAVSFHPNDFKIILEVIYEVYSKPEFSFEELSELLFKPNLIGTKADRVKAQELLEALTLPDQKSTSIKTYEDVLYMYSLA